MEITLQIVWTIITASISGIIGYFFYKLKNSLEQRAADEEMKIQSVLLRDNAINEALRALCSDRILQGYRYYKSKGKITTQDLATMSNLYKAYHALGGNGTITAVYEKILQLPIKSGV